MKILSCRLSSRRFLVGMLTTLASCLLVNTASAALLNLPKNYPTLTFGPSTSSSPNTPGATIYTSGDTIFLESAYPTAIRKSATDTDHFINPTGSPSSETIGISIRVNSAGQLIGGDGGNDLVVVGQVDLGSGLVAGTLLTGEIVQFGYYNAVSSVPTQPDPTTDLFDFRFRITGGLLAQQGEIFGPDANGIRPDLYMRVTSENSNFTGSFATDFAGQAKGNVWATPTTAIGDTVWLDANANGIQDNGELGVADVPVQLMDCNGAILATTTTDASGHYLFSGLVPGDYKVKVIAPAGYSLSPPDQGSDDQIDSDADNTGLMACTTLASGETDTSWDAGLVPDITIGDRVWNDTNGNGIQDNGEPGLQGVTVQLLDCNGTLVQTTTTDASGLYSFSVPPGGSYQIKVMIPAGFTASPAQQGGNPALDSNIDASGLVACAPYSTSTNDLDAGLVPDITIGDRVWNDLNGNGIQDNGEPGLQGVTVQLLDGNGALVTTTTTDASGLYAFTVPAGGSYQIKVALPAGFTASPAQQGGNPALDSNIDTSGLVASALYLISTNDVDAGLVPDITIGDRVWNDLNGNGIQDNGEPGLQGVTVQLLDGNGALVTTTTTDANGLYAFTVPAGGTYQIKVTIPAGFAASPAQQGGNPAQDSDIDGSGLVASAPYLTSTNDVDAGLYRLASVGDRVWNDANGNGSQDGGEPGLSGWTVTLAKKGGATVATITTGADGLYAFTNLVPGLYTVCTEPMAGYIETYDLDGLGSANCADLSLQPGDNRTDVDFGYLLSKPAIAIVKKTNGSDAPTGTGPYLTVGSAIHWTYAVTNTGNVPLANVAVTDSKGVTVTCPATLLAIGATMTCTGEGTATAGQYENIGYATGQDANHTEAQAQYASHYYGLQVTGCTYTQGYWKNHTDRWPASSLNLGSVQYGQDQLLAILNTPVAGNGLISLAHQLIAAKLNTLAGASTPPEVQDAIAIADSLIAAKLVPPVGSDSLDPATVGVVQTSLDTYNNGQATNGPGQCGDQQPATCTGSIGDFVWNDTNMNGKQDSGEPGIGGVTVSLTGTDAAGRSIASSFVTGANGAYQFSSLCAGSYQVKATTPSGFVPTTPLSANGNDGQALDSNAPAGTSLTLATDATANQTVDFGYFSAKAAITVSKYVSVDGGSSWQDANDPNGTDVPTAATCGASTSQADSVCTDGVTGLTLVYQGNRPAAVTVKDKNAQILYTGTVRPGQSFSFAGKAFYQTMTETITVYVNTKYHTSFRTDCGQPIGPGLVRGDFAVVDGTSRSGGKLSAVSCEEQSPAPCKSCSGRVKELTLEYQGISCYVRVTDKDGRELAGKTYMRPGQRLTFTGKDLDATMTDEVRVYLNGGYHCSFNTSSNEPIGPGRVKGWFKVVAGKSAAGGTLCPVSQDGTGYSLPEPTCAYTPSPPGCTPDKVRFKITVANTGNVPLSGLTLTDTPYGLGNCTVPDSLAANDSFQCLVGPLEAQPGLHTNTASASGTYNGTTVSASDTASYTGTTPSCGLVITKTANRLEVPKSTFDDGSCFDHEGYDKDGFDCNGHDRDGYDRDGFDKNGHCRKGHSQAEHERYGYDQDGYDRDGYDRTGCDRHGFDRHGFDKDGFDKDGFDKDGRCRLGHSKAYHQFKGCNAHGYDLDGFDTNGYNRQGYDRQGYDRTGCDKDGYNRQGWDRDGYDRTGHCKTERETGCNLPDDTCPTNNKVTYVYTVTNTGASPLANVTVKDDKLGFIAKLQTLGAGRTSTLTRTACVTDTTTNVVTATVDGLATCSATAQATVNAVCSDSDSEHSGYDHDGYDGDRCDKDGYDADGYDKNGYDRNGYSKSSCSLSSGDYSGYHD